MPTPLAPLDHAAARDLYSAHFDGELTSTESASLEAHLGACEACRAEYDEFRRMLGGLHHVRREDAPPDFVAGLKGTLRRRSRGRVFGRGGHVVWQLFPVLLVAILASIYVVLQLSEPGRLKLP